ncbi:MAG: cyclic nucleotide-binding domain-containing protein [Bdellovibrionales bacterium]
MSSSFENFRPKLRAGRVIPQGSRIIFETDNPYNQIVLPMSLADVILLCSGQFSVREIVEKLYKKQGAVPFRSMLQAMHLLHQGGFFENGSELTLNTHLHSWMEPRHNRLNFSWRFGQRIVADRKSPMAYYVVTLAVTIGAFFGLQMFPSEPLQMVEGWIHNQEFLSAILKLFICSSLIQSARHLVRGVQLLLLTGKAYNVSLRLSPWGLHLHVGDETNDLFENRLYTAMFHISQIVMGWFFIFCISPVLTQESIDTLIILNSLLSFCELNPFVNSDALKLLQSIMIRNDREIASWHFESSPLIKSLNESSFQRDQDFSRICAIWGSLWLIVTFSILHETAITFGPSVLNRLMHFTWQSAPTALGLVVWMLALFYVVQSFIETIVVSLFRPGWRRFASRIKNLVRRKTKSHTDAEVLDKIQNLPLFSHFQDGALARIIEHSQVQDFRENMFVIIQGDVSRDLYVLLDGEVEITRNSTGKSEWVSELIAVSIFGEASLLDDSPRQAQVMTKTRCSVLKVPVSYVRQMAEESHVIRHLEDFRNAILVNQFFSSSLVFRSLSPGSVEFLCSRGSLEYFDQNQVVFNQGEHGDSVYMILRGSVEVEVHGNSVKRLLQGNFFGEIALLANLPRTATVISNEPCVFFKISSDSFWEVLVQHIDLGVFLETVSENRLLEDLKMVAPLKRTGTDSK